MRRKKFDTAYSIDEIDLENVDTVKDLGILLDKSLNFIDHINLTYNKALETLGFIFRNCRELSWYSHRTLYYSLVRSILEYGSVMWKPGI